MVKKKLSSDDTSKLNDTMSKSCELSIYDAPADCMTEIKIIISTYIFVLFQTYLINIFDPSAEIRGYSSYYREIMIYICDDIPIKLLMEHVFSDDKE